MIGMPPATAASNSRSTPASSLTANSSVPTLASSSLLAVTTGLPPRNADVMSSRAGSMPPMTSTTKSMDGSATTAWASRVSTPSARSTSRSRLRLRTATEPSSSRTPVRASIVACWAITSLTSAEPTLPQPSTPIRTSFVTGGRLGGGASPSKPFAVARGLRRRLKSETTDPLPTSTAASTSPPVPAPVVGSTARAAVVRCGDGASWDFCGLWRGSASDATQAGCCTPLSSVTTLSTPSAQADASHETCVVTLASSPLSRTGTTTDPSDRPLKRHHLRCARVEIEHRHHERRRIGHHELSAGIRCRVGDHQAHHAVAIHARDRRARDGRRLGHPDESGEARSSDESRHHEF